MASTAEQLFKQLEEQLEEKEYVSASKTCESILAQKSDDKEALLCKLVCLLHTSKFEEAESLLDSDLKGFKDELVYERAYLYYRTARLDEAAALLNGKRNILNDEEVGKLESFNNVKEVVLLAQIFYRAGKFDDAIDIYRKLARGSLSPEEVNCNLLAAYVAPAIRSTDIGMTMPSTHFQSFLEAGRALLTSNKSLLETSYDFCYNAAALEIAGKDYTTSGKLLQKAQELCAAHCKAEEWSEEDTRNESAILRVQAAFIEHILGQEKQAMEGYDGVLHGTLSDRLVSAIASNNVSVVHDDHNLFDSCKKLERNQGILDSAEHKEILDKLTPSQRHSIMYNYALVLLKMGSKEKVKQAEEFCKRMTTAFPASPFPFLLLGSMYLRRGQVSEAVEILRGFGKVEGQGKEEPNPPAKAVVRLALSQIRYQQKNYEEALSILQSGEDDIAFFPAVVGAVVFLYSRNGNAADSYAYLEKALGFWLKKYADDGQDPVAKEMSITMLEVTSTYATRLGKYDKAASFLKKLIALDASKKKKYMLSLLIVLAHIDPAEAVQLEGTMGNVPQISTAEVDVAALEALPIGVLSQQKAVAEVEEKAEKGKESDVQKIEKKPRKKKKQKKKLPKNYDPNFVHPDPERWKPLRDRSYYRRKRGRGAKEKARGGHQGAAVMDESSGAAAASASQATSSTAAVGAKGGAGNKRKGRR